MKKFLSSLLLALTVLIAASPVYADGESISSVTVVGAIEQSGTPTPTTPIDIVSNNGVLKVSPNLFDKNNTLADKRIWTNGAGSQGSLSGYYGVNPIKVKGGHTYTRSGSHGGANYFLLDDNTSFSFLDNSDTITVPDNAVMWYFNNTVSTDRNTMMVVEGNALPAIYIPYGEIYTDGEVETIGDSANHTANVATLLGVGDYRDTQNINTGAITRNVGIKVLDGSENWTGAQAGSIIRYRIQIDDAVGGTNRSAVLSTHFVYITSGQADGGAFLSSKYLYLVPDQTITTVNDFKSWLATQYANGTPVTIIYPLATPTTESVAGQAMTTAPVNNRTGGVAGMTITTLLSSGASVVTTIATNAIKIATTAYNTARFSPVVNDLNSTVATIREIVTNTINQTAAIASLQADKQTRPEDACPAGKKCLLVETEENGVIVPHWFPIIEAPE